MKLLTKKLYRNTIFVANLEMKRMNDEHLTYFEKRLTAEIEDIEQRIKTLVEEKRALQRQLAKAHAERSGLQQTSRKNSINRVLAENIVLQTLREEGKPVSTAKLYKNALVANYELKENTFRTYLHRMKKKGLIKTARNVGSWELPQTSNNLSK